MVKILLSQVYRKLTKEYDTYGKTFGVLGKRLTFLKIELIILLKCHKILTNLKYFCSKIAIG